MEEVLERLLAYGEYTGLIEKEDTIYCYNSLAGLLAFEPKACNEEHIKEEIKKIKKEELESGEYLEKVLKEILDYALVKGIMEDDSTITRIFLIHGLWGFLRTDLPIFESVFGTNMHLLRRGLPNIFISSVRIMTISAVIVSKRISAIR